MQTQRDLILRSWLESEFRSALLDDEKIRMFAAMIQVGRDKGDEPLQILRIALAGFVGDLIAPEIGDEHGRHDAWLKRN